MKVAEQTIGSSGRTGEDRAQRAPEYPRTLEYPADTDDEVAVQKRFLEGLRAEMAEGPRPRQLLVTLMADYWITPGASAPSGALVDLLEEFDVPPSGTRTLLSKLCRQGRLESFKEGRRTFYSIAPGSRRRLVSGFSAIARFGAEKEPDPFIWTCLMFSVPEGMRTRRLRLHKGLRWMGFAPLYDGVWVSPQAAREQVDALLKSQEISSATVFEATAYSAGLTYGQPTDAWSIPTLQDQYARFLDEAGQALQRVSEGRSPQPRRWSCAQSSSTCGGAFRVQTRACPWDCSPALAAPGGRRALLDALRPARAAGELHGPQRRGAPFTGAHDVRQQSQSCRCRCHGEAVRQRALVFHLLTLQHIFDMLPVPS
ncbi:hypothetical protein [Nesterenkonia pannonica]|uniref:hypothetical protein n=1 Tax=Nesterenkonia pannonica TaxID=1548602 RepID=UPI002164B9F5|nr:hypothetical protein [Nesterenkonia pannonica]